MQPIVIDTETTGVDVSKDAIVEIAAVYKDASGEERIFESFCNPGSPIPPTAMAVHHITDDMVAQADTPTVVLDHFAASLKGLRPVFVAHNAEFDREIIGRIRPGIRDVPWICTWRCALHLWPEAPAFGNQVLRYWKGVNPEIPIELYPHRALYDVIVTEAILQEMLKTTTLETLIDLTNKPALLQRIKFGKHRGSLWSEVPKDYLRWVSNQNMDRDVIHTAKHWLNQ